MTTTVNSIEQFKKGIEVTQDAIINNNIPFLQSCLARFTELKAPAEVFSEALKDCPLGLLNRSGFNLKIFSEVLQKEIILGDTLSWDEVDLIARHGLSGESLKTVLSARDIFNPGAFIESIEAMSTEQITEDLTLTTT